MIVEIIVECKVVGGDGIFSYLIPDELLNKIKVGSIVEIPFGKRIIRGVVIKIRNPNPFDRLRTGVEIRNKSEIRNYKLKNIFAINSEFKIPEKYIEIAQWVAKYYLCSFGEAISLFMPPIIKYPRNKIQDTNKLEIRNSKFETNSKLNQLTNDQNQIYKTLAKNLTSDQKKPACRQAGPALILGVTGSGKTEIYLHLAEKTIEMGKLVVLLVPEIVLTPQNIERFEEIFASEVVLIHSGLSKSERFHCYKSFYSGEKKIIIGPRSALLVPNNNIGLIIIDEEQEESYKQEQNPRYDATALAEKIAKETGALLVLGSATPRIETFHKAKSGEYQLFELSGRYNLLTLPTADIVDLRDEIKRENFSPISEKLQAALAAVLKRKEQAILFLNRRGMSTFVSCRDCGYVVTCDRCEIPMIQHLSQSGNYIICHHCAKRGIIPAKCPECSSLRIKYFGSGVEKIELEIARLFPKARIKRVDAKVLRNHTDYETFYQDFKNHKFDIVIGTQILAKGFDIPGVSLVGIVSADVGLHMPYFRASEKIFRIITQVSGRSGRRSKPGQTIIQTYWPESAAIKFASKHDFVGFYNEEIKKREKKNYPPKTHIIRVLSEDHSQEKARREIVKLAQELSKKKINYIGPGPCFFQRLNNKFRYQIIIKILKLPNLNISLLFSRFSNLTWDVDALNLL